jgi:anhydro-N-acetylmuramic acid kinase
MPEPLYVGLMSGTSVDAIDCALVRCVDGRVEMLATHEHPIPPPIKQKIAAISHPGDDEIERLGPLDRELGVLFADATLELLHGTGHRPVEVAAIGSHGQTIRHRPPSSQGGQGCGFTLQIGDPNSIAQKTGITTVADFRRRDMAAGGEGAPLAPAFHAAAFAASNSTRVVVNIGGIANATLLWGIDRVEGFDTGPGNTLMDHWIARHRGQPYDRDGQWAAEAEVLPALMEALLRHDYLAQRGPRSTGKEAFNLAWVDACIAALPAPPAPQQVQATLAEFTAESIARGIREVAPEIDEIYVCGGGARNIDLMRRLYRKMPTTRLDTTAALGIEPEWVEAAAFAWLAWRSLEGLAGNVPAVTGAECEVVLGGIYPGGAPLAMTVGGT